MEWRPESESSSDPDLSPGYSSELFLDRLSLMRIETNPEIALDIVNEKFDHSFKSMEQYFGACWATTSKRRVRDIGDVGGKNSMDKSWYWMQAHEADFLYSYEPSLIRTGQTRRMLVSARGSCGTGARSPTQTPGSETGGPVQAEPITSGRTYEEIQAERAMKEKKWANRERQQQNKKNKNAKKLAKTSLIIMMLEVIAKLRGEVDAASLERRAR